MDKVYTMDKKPYEENTKEAPLPEANQPIENTSDLNEEEIKKNLILKNYSFIDFVTLEKITFDYISTTEGKEQICICPNGEDSKDGVDYYIFFNIDDNYKKLQKYYDNQLNYILNKHNYYLEYDRESLLEKSKSKIIETNLILLDYDKFRPFYYIIKGIGMTWKKKYYTNANIYATNCGILNYILDDKVLRNQAITINKNLNALICRISSNNFILMKQSYKTIMKSEESELNKVKNIESYLNNYISNYKKKSEKNENTKIELLYCIYQANHYLGKFERDLQNKDYQTLLVMDKFRRQLNKYFMEYRFQTKKNFTAFYQIKINSCKIILKTKDLITLYIDRTSTQNYINKIYETLDQKASNIQRDYKLDAFKENELRDIAKSGNFESYEKLLLTFDEQINEKEYEEKKLKIEGNKKILKSGISLIKTGTEIYLKSQTGSILITKEIIESLKNKEENKNNSEVLNSIKELNIDNQIDDIFEGFNSFNLKDKIEKDIELLKRQKSQLEDKKEYLNEFIGIVKLYNLLKKKKYDERNDYEGILLTGKIKNENFNDLLSEYNIEEF